MRDSISAGLRVPETPREEGQGFDPPGQLLAVLALGGLVGATIEVHPLGATHPAVLGLALLIPLDARSPYGMALPAFVLIPLGMRTGVPAMIGALLGSVERSRSGAAAASSVLLLAMALAARTSVPGRGAAP